MLNHNRYVSLDLFKGLGIIYLLLLHQLIWSFVRGDIGGLTYPQAEPIIYLFGYKSGLYCLGFQVPLLAGITFYLASVRKKTSLVMTIVRAVLLAAAGVAMNFLAWGYSSMWDWDVLQYLAVSMLISYVFIRYLPAWKGSIVLMVLGVLALFFSNQYPFSQWQDYYLYKIIIGDADGFNYWPLSPWFVLFALGVFMGEVLHRQHTKIWSKLPIVGGVFLVASILSGKFFPEIAMHDQVWGATLFKPSPLFMIGLMGFSLVAIPLVENYLSKNSEVANKLASGRIVLLGRGILGVYLITTILGFNITSILIYNYNVNFVQMLILFPVLIFFYIFVGQIISRFMVSQKERLRNR